MKRTNKRRFIVTSASSEARFYNEQIAKAYEQSVSGHLLEIIN